MLLTFAGPASLSAFRRAALLSRCQERLPRLRDLQAAHVYLVQVHSALTKEQHRHLEQLLDVPEGAGPADLSAVLVCPRPGTISPWSSKATDILHNCGLEQAVRVERGTAYSFVAGLPLTSGELAPVLSLLYDRMTEAVVPDPELLFRAFEPRPLVHLPLRQQGRRALEQTNAQLGLALSAEEIDYFQQVFVQLGRDPTDVELMMFSVVNSEHCRHKIFNAAWVVDDRARERSLFEMIRHTHAQHPEDCVKAYSDNSGVIRGFRTRVFRPLSVQAHRYCYEDKQVHILMKVETHNHPTAISPYPGASTGTGGEIRDEGATGVGGQSQAGLCAFFTSHLRVPGFPQPWEQDWAESPGRLATPLEIMTAGPLGAAGFGNEFGRPNILGVFRTCEDRVAGRYRGYHKPIMVAGGVGLIDEEHVDKKDFAAGDHVVQIGGPAMLIGLGGGTASSMDTGSSLEELDFASVQRDNPEMQRRCQELINRCIALGPDNPILSIHDVGAGGLSNACPELVERTGARFELRAIDNAEPGMSPMQLWSNEAQERYVLVVGRQYLECFSQMARRERCLFRVIGQVTGDGRLHLHDSLFHDDPIDQLDLGIILGKPPRMLRRVRHLLEEHPPLDLTGVSVEEAVARVLRLPAVASKTFLITIADRTVTGLVARDQMVGPHQVPVADVAVTATSFQGYTGSAMAMGERTPLALVDAPASGRMAVAEALTNIAGAAIGPIGRVKLSANWMCACGEEGEDALLYDTVEAVAMDFCPELGVAIPVGKDSLSMRTVWSDSRGRSHTNVAPLSLVISAFAPVEDIRRTLTPVLVPDPDSRLLLVDLGRGRNRLGGSALAQVYNQMGDQVPDVAPGDVRALFDAVQELGRRGLLLAYHDRSDGGLLAAAAEMAFAGRCGLSLDLDPLGPDPLASLFSEEIGSLLQCRVGDLAQVRGVLEQHALADSTHEVGRPAAGRWAHDLGHVGNGVGPGPGRSVDQRAGSASFAGVGGRGVDAATAAPEISVVHRGAEVYRAVVASLLQAWSELTYRMQTQRDDPECAREEYESLADPADPGMSFHVPFEVAPAAVGRTRPRVAILREQGVNGQVEMAAAFEAAGCDAVDVTMTDLLEGTASLDTYQGLAACGGFSYGDVLGAGAGWARSVLFNARLRDAFAAFFGRPDTFALGVCNGCQMLSLLKDLIPGAGLWPRFRRNRSEQFEARYVTVEVLESRSVLLRGMSGARLGIACAHGEGRAGFSRPEDLREAQKAGQVGMRFVDHHGRPTERYPLNPNGSPEGVTCLTSTDGRATILMPHPERVFRNVQLSWRPPEWTGEASPWLRLFQNACEFARQS